MDRRNFNKSLAAAGVATALYPFGIARAESRKLKVGVLLPRSSFQAQIGQSCQKGADLAPAVIKQLLGVDIELMNADTESNVNTARARAERLIDEGANVLVGAFDSGQTLAIAQVAEQRGVPLVINQAAAPQITEQGYKFVFRNFPNAIDLTRNGLSLIGDLFKATNTAPRTAVYMHVNATFGEAMTRGINALMPQMPFKIVESIGYDPAARDLSVEVSKAKATNADFLMLVGLVNDSIIIRREMVKQRWHPMGLIGPGSPGLNEEQFSKSLGKYANYVIDNLPWYNPKGALTNIVQTAFKKLNPKDNFAYDGINVGYTFEAMLIAADAFKRAGSDNPKQLADAIRQTNIIERVCLGGPIKFDAKGQVQGNLSACIQILDGVPRVVLPAYAAEAEPVFPWPEYKNKGA